MLVFEAKLEGLDEQYQALDEAIRTARFVRNACLWQFRPISPVKIALTVVRLSKRLLAPELMFVLIVGIPKTGTGTRRGTY
jgi:hypothetical protein